MRAFVCTDYGSVIRKLVWLNESRAGVYVGMYDKSANPHASYHADGTHHLKIVHRGEEVTPFQEQKLPICSIPTYHSILGHTAFYEDSTMSQPAQVQDDPEGNRIRPYQSCDLRAHRSPGDEHAHRQPDA